MSDITKKVPTDATGNVFDRAQSVPVVIDNQTLGSDVTYVDIVDFANYPDRAFIGIGIENASNAASVEIAIGGNFTTDRCIKVSPESRMFLDDQLFGAAVENKKLRAKLDVPVGTLAVGDFSYAGVNPGNGTLVEVNGTNFEFSNDASAAPGNIYVAIGVSADASWTNLMNAINSNEQAVTATINTGTDVLTITSNYGGVQGDSITISTTVPGVTPSGATLTGGAGGLTPTIHLW